MIVKSDLSAYISVKDYDELDGLMPLLIQNKVSWNKSTPIQQKSSLIDDGL